MQVPSLLGDDLQLPRCQAPVQHAWLVTSAASTGALATAGRLAMWLVMVMWDFSMQH